MTSRYVEPKSPSRARLRNFIALDNLTAQMPLIELISSSQAKRHVRIWVAYDYERKHGTYTAVYASGLVETVTVYPSGLAKTIVNRQADRRKRNVRRRRQDAA